LVCVDHRSSLSSMTAEARATPGGSALHKMSWARRMVSSRLVGAFIGKLQVNPKTTPFRVRPFHPELPALGCSCRIVAPWPAGVTRYFKVSFVTHEDPWMKARRAFAWSRALGTPFASHARACGPVHECAARGLVLPGSPWR